jgi:hypothetical protein
MNTTVEQFQNLKRQAASAINAGDSMIDFIAKYHPAHRDLASDAYRLSEIDNAKRAIPPVWSTSGARDSKSGMFL